MSADREFAAVVVGGGPAGAAAARTLAGRGYRVLLIDEATAGFRTGEALPPAALPLLRDLGVVDRFLADGHLPCYGTVSVWGGDESRVTDFVSHPRGHGWHLDRPRFDGMLRESARAAGATVAVETRALDAGRDGAGWRVVVGTDKASRRTETVRAAWLVDATGRRSVVARRLGVRRVRGDRLIAVCMRFSPPGGEQADRDSRTVIESVPDGWWYTALVPSGERVVVHLTDGDLSGRAGLNSTTGFCALLAASPHIGRLLTERGFRPRDGPRAVDAGSARLDRFGGNGWLAAGDAALSFDPLSAQGMLTALYTGLLAGQAVARSLAGEHDPVGRYLRRLDDIYSSYRMNLRANYVVEERWRDRPFWRRRLKAS